MSFLNHLVTFGYKGSVKIRLSKENRIIYFIEGTFSFFHEEIVNTSIPRRKMMPEIPDLIFPHQKVQNLIISNYFHLGK